MITTDSMLSCITGYWYIWAGTVGVASAFSAVYVGYSYISLKKAIAAKVSPSSSATSSIRSNPKPRRIEVRGRNESL